MEFLGVVLLSLGISLGAVFFVVWTLVTNLGDGLFMKALKDSPSSVKWSLFWIILMNVVGGVLLYVS